MKWTKREMVPPPAYLRYSDIWDGDGWQINKLIEDRPEPFVLLDALQPHQIPASCVQGHYRTLEDAKRAAARLGRPDWSQWDGDDWAEVHRPGQVSRDRV